MGHEGKSTRACRMQVLDAALVTNCPVHFPCCRSSDPLH